MSSTMLRAEHVLLGLIEQQLSLVGDLGHQPVDDDGQLLLGHPHRIDRLDAQQDLIADDVRGFCAARP